MKLKVIINAAIFIGLIILQINISGCAGIEREVNNLWKQIQWEFSDHQTGTREEARDRYKGRREELIIESPVITPKAARSGEKIKQELQFTLFSMREGKLFNVSETVFITTAHNTIELTKKESMKAQGIHTSIVQFVIPKDLSAGEYKLITTISTGEQKKTVSGSFRVKK